LKELLPGRISLVNCGNSARVCSAAGEVAVGRSGPSDKQWKKQPSRANITRKRHHGGALHHTEGGSEEQRM
ncbi:hypothetical protein NDU88_004034, partial [Pleurodeles waltl]